MYDFFQLIKKKLGQCVTCNSIRMIKEDFLAVFKQTVFFFVFFFVLVFLFFFGGGGGLGTRVTEAYIQELEVTAYLAPSQTATHFCH